MRKPSPGQHGGGPRPRQVKQEIFSSALVQRAEAGPEEQAHADGPDRPEDQAGHVR
jgi:hypothetical protein